MRNCTEALALQFSFFKYVTLISLYSASEQPGSEEMGLKEVSKPQRMNQL